MKAINNYLLAMKEGKPFNSQKEECEYILLCAASMKEDIMDYIFTFNESERQREYELTMRELWEKALYYSRIYPIVASGFVSCLLGLQSDMVKRGFAYSLDERIENLSEDITRKALTNYLGILHDPFMRGLYFNENTEEKTPGETIPKKKPGRPQKAVLEAIIYKNKEMAFEVLKECLEGKKGVELAYLVEAAIILGLIKEEPSFSAMKEELGVTGVQYGFWKAFTNIHKPKSSSAQTNSRRMDYAKNILKETLERKQNNHGNN